MRTEVPACAGTTDSFQSWCASPAGLGLTPKLPPTPPAVRLQANSPPHTNREGNRMEQLTSSVYAETQIRGCNHGFVVTSEGVVMIDSPQKPSDALKLKEEIAKHGELRYIINTEPHGDHWTGNAYFDVSGNRPRGSAPTYPGYQPGGARCPGRRHGPGGSGPAGELHPQRSGGHLQERHDPPPVATIPSR